MHCKRSWLGGRRAPCRPAQGATGLAETPGTLSLPRTPVSFLTSRPLLLLRSSPTHSTCTCWAGLD